MVNTTKNPMIMTAISALVATMMLPADCFKNIPKDAQITTNEYAISFRTCRTIAVNTIATIMTTKVSISAPIPNGSTPSLTNNAEMFAIVAMVIHPKYTLMGTWMNHFSPREESDLPMSNLMYIMIKESNKMIMMIMDTSTIKKCHAKIHAMFAMLEMTKK